MAFKSSQPWYDQPAALRHLRLTAGYQAAGHGMAALAGFLWLYRSGLGISAVRWLIPAAVALLWVHVVLRRYLDLNHPPGLVRLFPALGVPNTITLGRGCLTAMLAGFLGLPAPSPDFALPGLEWIPGLLYLTTAIADFVDGRVARQTGRETRLGKRLDVEMDALGILVAGLLGIYWGRLPAVYLLAGLAYYGFRFGIRYRRRRCQTVRNLIPRPLARIAAGLNMGFLAVALLPLFSTRILKISAIFFMLPLVGGFIWDWLIVSDSLSHQLSQHLRKKLQTQTDRLLSILRVLVLTSGIPILTDLYRSQTIAVTLCVFLLWGMLVVGCLGRTAAIAAGLGLAHLITVNGSSMALWVTFCCTLTFIILGTGKFSLWQPEIKWLNAKSAI